MTLDEAFNRIKRSQFKYLDIVNLIDEKTEHDYEKLISFQMSLHECISETVMSAEIDDDPRDVFDEILEENRKKFEEKENLAEAYDKLNELKRGKNKRKFDLNHLFERLRNFGVEPDEREAYLINISFLNMAEKYGDAAVNILLQLQNLMAVDLILYEKINENDKENLPTKETITREYIFDYCKSLKDDGMTEKNLFNRVEDLLLNKLKFTREEVKEQFNFSLEEYRHFNKFLSNHI